MKKQLFAKPPGRTLGFKVCSKCFKRKDLMLTGKANALLEL
jgi:hypothetical protein